MVEAIVQRNPAGKFECIVYIEGEDAMKFVDSRVISHSVAIPFVIQFSGSKETHRVVITDKKPESGPTKSPTQWLIEGYFVENGQRFKGYYNTRTRNGHIRFID